MKLLVYKTYFLSSICQFFRKWHFSWRPEIVHILDLMKKKKVFWKEILKFTHFLSNFLSNFGKMALYKNSWLILVFKVKCKSLDFWFFLCTRLHACAQILSYTQLCVLVNKVCLGFFKSKDKVVGVLL